ncbi:MULTISPECIES: sensor domain-containing diguanylate cyclase [Dyella]|nr:MULTISPECIES: sensor domain-containing diguanylate cyclase [Dyella]
MPSIPSSLPTTDFMGMLASSVSQARTLEDLTRPLLELLQTVTGLDSTYLTTIDLDAGVQRIVYARNTRELDIPEGLAVPWEGTLCKRALEEDRLYTDDVAECWADSAPARELGISTYASSPVRTEDGELYGTLCAASMDSLPLAEGSMQVLQMFSRLIAQQIDRERLVSALRRANDSLAVSALTDTTTRLPNRRALMDQLRHRLSLENASHVLLVAFIDLDGFKAINDKHGHETGDRFLSAIGGRMQGAMRDMDFVARHGGDEFVVLSEAPHGDAEACLASLRERLESACSGRYNLGGLLLDYAGPSIGIVVARPGEHECEALLAQADAAMYEVKRARRAARV